MRAIRLLVEHFKINTSLKDNEDRTAMDLAVEFKQESIIQYFGDAGNQNLVSRLKDFGLQLAMDESSLEGQSEKLAGKIFVVSGVFHIMSRNELKKSIEDNGGKVSGSISKKTSYVIAGDNMGPSKKVKAEGLGVAIISEQDYLDLLNQ